MGPVPGWQAELLSDALLGFGAQSVVVEEYPGEGAEEQPRYGVEAELWDECQLLAHFPLEVRSVRDIPAQYHSNEEAQIETKFDGLYKCLHHPSL